MVYSTRRFDFYVVPCVILLLCFSVLLALRLPCLGKRELVLVLFVHLFDLCLFGFVCFLFLLVSRFMRFVIVALPGPFSYPIFAIALFYAIGFACMLKYHLHLNDENT